jgi:hypothetical protein
MNDITDVTESMMMIEAILRELPAGTRKDRAARIESMLRALQRRALLEGASLENRENHRIAINVLRNGGGPDSATIANLISGVVK